VAPCPIEGLFFFTRCILLQISGGTAFTSPPPGSSRRRSPRCSSTPTSSARTLVAGRTRRGAGRARCRSGLSGLMMAEEVILEEHQEGPARRAQFAEPALAASGGEGGRESSSPYQKCDIQQVTRWVEQILPFSLLLLVVFIRHTCKVVLNYLHFKSAKLITSHA
jgi:hypothetical protein